MFSFVKERKAEAALAAISPGVLALIGSATPTERAAALAVANAMLLSGAAQWGRAFSHEPMKISREAACDALCVLADHHLKLEGAAGSVVGRPPSDPQVSACKWELVATQVVMVTTGASFGRQYADVARKAWQALSAARRNAPEAVRALMEYARAYSIDPVPPVNGKNADRDYLSALASSLPPMFRRRKPSR